VGDLRTTTDGGLVPPAQMFALCGVMIIVGIAYIAVAPQPPPADAPVAVAAPATELAAAVLPVARPAAESAATRTRSLDAQANGAPVRTSVPAITPSVPVSSPPSTTARVTIPTTVTTVTPPPTISVTTTVVPTSTTSLLSITLSAPSLISPATPPPTSRLSGQNDSGVASWFNAPDATCAHRTLPFGTTVKVTRPRTGAVAYCKVNDRGPTLATGRLIDLSMDTFSRLALPSAGLIDVTIEW
jgi:hypothetical protein